MISGIRDRSIYLKPGHTDMRKQINGLATMDRESLKRDPFSGACFMFYGRRRNILKILYWDDTGSACGPSGWKRTAFHGRGTKPKCGK